VSKPPRDQFGPASNTYFVTTNTSQGAALFQSQRLASLLIETLFSYRNQAKFHLHEFVVMPNHLHVILSPADSINLERSLQFIKGGFSYRVGKELGLVREIWQRGYVDHRVRDEADYAYHRAYIHQNPVRAALTRTAEEYPYSSAYEGFALDAAPQRLKPVSRVLERHD
jgi:putative transposase